MALKLKKVIKRRVFEADGDNQQNANAQQPQNNGTQPAAPATPANGTPAPQPQNNTQANAAPATPAPAPATDNNQPQNPQTPQQPQQQEDPKLAENREKATQCINSIQEVIKQNNPYALLAFNVPDTFMATFPNMKDDANAKDTMSKWEAFKKSPSQETFNSMIDAFSTFANGGQPINQDNNANPQQNQNTQPNQPQQTQNNTPTQQQAANATTNQNEDEHSMLSFGERLNEKLNERLALRKAQAYMGYGFQSVLNIKH